MKFGKTVASILAATMAVSVMSVSAFAEEDKIDLITAEIPAEFTTSMVYFDGVGVVDINGEKFDSSENYSADKDANLDVDFDGLGYVSEKNLEAWRDTGVLTFSKLKADFDTTGLQWGMFHAKNNYVQLVKMEKGWTEVITNPDGSKQEINHKTVIHERGLYKITDGEIKKLCDLDTFWTDTREDGVSVGVEIVKETIHLTPTYDTEGQLELNLVITQPDGTRTVKTVAKSNITDVNINCELEGIEQIKELEKYTLVGGHATSCPWSGDNVAAVAFGMTTATKDFIMQGSMNEVKIYYSDGTEKEIFKSEDNKYSLRDFAGFSNGNLVWYTVIPPSSDGYFYFYNAETGKTESCEFKYGVTPYPFRVSAFDERIVAECNPTDEYSTNTNYAIFKNPEDIKNYKSKTYYKDITSCDDNVYLYETLDGKKGYMDGDENVLAEYDDAEAFSDNYAPVVKDGKAYLVDREMNCVSEQIDADSVVAVSDNIFIVNKGNKKYFVTYAGEEESENPPSSAVLVDYSDDATGITASANEGVVEDGAELSVSAVADKTDDNNFTYEISFKKDDKDVQPNGAVTVKIPVPEAIKDKKIYVYRVEGDKYYDMGAKAEDGCVVFKTNHFSEYLVTTNAVEGAVNDNPDTGIPRISFAMAAIAAAGLIVVGKKRK